MEVGAYRGEGGLGEDGRLGGTRTRQRGGETEPRRVAARRHDRGGRFASAFFFVEERRMIKEELELEAEEGNKGKPLTF